MVTDGQKQRGLKLTDQDVRGVASLILEELLEDRIDKDVRGHRKVRRIRTAPERGKVCIRISESENAVARSSTLPSNYRELLGGELKQKNVQGSSENIHQEDNPQNVDSSGSPENIHQKDNPQSVDSLESPDTIHQEDNQQSVDSSGSSADTEDNNPSNVSEKRKKKSFLKRARERLTFAFRRNRNKDNVSATEASGQAHSEKQKTKNKTGKGIHESQRHVKEHTGDRFVDGTEDRDYVDKDGPVQAEVRSSKKWKSNILSSFRKPKKSREAAGDSEFQKRINSKVNQHENSRNGVDKSVPRKALPPSSLQVQSTYQGLPSLPQQTSAAERERSDSSELPRQQSPGHYQSLSESVASSHGTPLSLPGAYSLSGRNLTFSGTNETSTSESTLHPDTRYNLAFNNTLSISIYSNVLDSPGEDIEYIDAVDAESRDEYSNGSYSKQAQYNKRLYKFHAGHLEDSRPANQFADGSHVTDVEVDPRVVFIQRTDGGTEAATVITARPMVIPDEAAEEEYDELDGVDDEPADVPNPDPGREALYSAIAQRLIEMGDSYSATMSDKKSKSEDTESKNHLSSLEIDIIDFVRSAGDNMTRQSKQDMYHRFQSTVQNTFHGEISWNHLTLLFYATKNVVSVVGKGSRAAVLAKDLTVQYVTDSCASWIIDQVGSDILLSSEESDFGVD